MHALSDLLLEAVVNSTEAGAREIAADIHLGNGIAVVTVVDDGRGPSVEPFTGLSTKGKGRGMGLRLIEERSGGKCSLKREGDRTVLRFESPYDGSFDDPGDAFFPIFQAGRGIRLSSAGDIELVFSGSEIESRGIDLERADGISLFKETIRKMVRTRRENG